jgi:hypothetical protein
MAERIAKAKADLAVLDRIGEPEAKAHYLDNLDLEDALAAADKIKENRARLMAIEETRKAQEAARRANAEKEAKEAADHALEPVAARETAIEEPIVLNLRQETVVPKTEEILERRMVVRGTLNQIIALSRFMNENGIDFEKIEGGSF